MHRAVVHLPEEARVGQALRNVRNLLDDFSGDVEVVPVLNGDAVGALAPASPHAELFRELPARNVRIAACARALRKYGLDPGGLVEGVVAVPGGVTGAVRPEADGFAYLRPRAPAGPHSIALWPRTGN
jgi:intracellular sulfur oxidation DsrE/DsrF family protein